MSISENMRKIRLQKGLTQKQVAEACGMVDGTYRTYELGKANPKPATAAKIAKALHVSVAELYGVDWTEDARPQLPEISSALYQAMLADVGGALPIDVPYQDRLLAAYRRLNEKGQLALIERAEEMGQIQVYQAEPGFLFRFTEEERSQISASLSSIQEQELELKLMREKNPPVPDNHNAVVSAKAIINERQNEIIKIFLNALKANPQFAMS